MDAMEIARTWLDGQHDGHLLQFEFLFNINQQATYFRTMNHIRMLKAYCDSQKAHRLRSEIDLQSYSIALAIHRERIMSQEQHHLLLSVNRMRVLGCAFDQLWQRHKSELLRPLKVRLGEEDAFEVGHDLGGVQIEFFNTICRTLFHEDLQMFTTDPTTGFSCIRPGCLQPLYMFELCGLLFALALYNGITLPIRLPEIYYGMLSGRSEDIQDPLADAWPKDRKALSEIAEYDIPGLQFTFPIESNGLRLSILMEEETCAPEDFTPDQRRTMKIVDATPIAHHPDPSTPTAAHQQSTASSLTSPPLPVDIQAIATSWPGWHLIPAHTEPPDVDPSNIALYTSLYTAHLRHLSVQPQLTSFRRGFAHILPPPLLRALSLPSLRTLLEGDTHFSLAELQAITQYDGYDPAMPYIASFWRVLDRWPVAKQMRLLKFVTACERVPAGGVGCLTFVIKRVVDFGEEEDEAMLPTSSTCFGTLGLPLYRNEGVLERKLSLALEFGLEGFGIA
ncbi:hypothetical protein BDY17DRAFT_310887 [Neohortaea acidophila]|uniref:HECT-type E3 ubiquitin transferase n=1 Tax=Neohortaea acidophila TaxID=245834 RepID=A0A6A6PQM4_9PEZI|nr:uncharacterized protein BDY17DRAFT_310887 [Neohortaea acidophila]KAF2482400.1 hypothetical protein BDY17DRAFT_310887 [Neohortaea acidophila]